jgi:uncharacterized membrane protein YphA (DoxX/SURF4 family)
MGALRLQPFVGIMDHLGYPRYFTTVIGVWYLLAGLALIAPRFARLKEWAYGGLIFVYTGAAASRLVAGDGAAASAAPVVLSGLAFTFACSPFPKHRFYFENLWGRPKSSTVGDA